LNPQWKWDYFTHSKLPEWIVKAKSAVKELWESHYKSTAFDLSVIPSEPSEPTENEFYIWMH
jgi:hypothetical protein